MSFIRLIKQLDKKKPRMHEFLTDLINRNRWVMSRISNSQSELH
jgi:hypothetical protein